MSFINIKYGDVATETDP